MWLSRDTFNAMKAVEFEESTPDPFQPTRDALQFARDTADSWQPGQWAKDAAEFERSTAVGMGDLQRVSQPETSQQTNEDAAYSDVNNAVDRLRSGGLADAAGQAIGDVMGKAGEAIGDALTNVEPITAAQAGEQTAAPAAVEFITNAKEMVYPHFPTKEERQATRDTIKANLPPDDIVRMQQSWANWKDTPWQKEGRVPTTDEIAAVLEKKGLGAQIASGVALAAVQPGGNIQPSLGEGISKAAGAAGQAAELLSKSGRPLTPPKFSQITSDRTAKNAVGKVDAWLHAEALTELGPEPATGRVFQDDPNSLARQMVSRMDPKKLSTADRDMLNDILFGDTEGRMLNGGKGKPLAVQPKAAEAVGNTAKDAAPEPVVQEPLTTAPDLVGISKMGEPPTPPPDPPVAKMPEPEPISESLPTTNNFEPVHVQSGYIVHGKGTGYHDAETVTPEAADRLNSTIERVRSESPVVDWERTIADAKTYGADPEVLAALNRREGGLATTIQAIRAAQTDIEREIATIQDARVRGDLAPNEADAKVLDLAAQSVDLIGTINRAARESARAMNALKIGLSYKDAENAATMWQARANQLENAAAIVKRAKKNGKLTPTDAAELKRVASQQEKQAPPTPTNGTAEPQPAAPRKPRTVTPKETAQAMKTVKAVDEETQLWRRYIDLNREAGEARLGVGARDTATIEAERAQVRDQLYTALEDRALKAAEKEKPADVMTPEQATNAMKDRMAAGIRAQWASEIKQRVREVRQPEGDITTLAQSKTLGKITDRIGPQIQKDLEAWTKDVEAQTASMESTAVRTAARERTVAIGDLVREMADSGEVRRYADELLRRLGDLGTEARAEVARFRTNYNQAQVRKLLGADAPKPGSPEFEAVVSEFAKLDFTDPRAIARFASYMHKPGFWEHARAYRAASMLTGTATQLVNTIGNAIMTAYGPAYRLAAGAAEEVATLGGRTRPKDAYASQAGAELAGFITGFRPALNEARHTWETGISTRAIRDLGHAHMTQLSGPFKPLNTVFRGLGTADDFFRSLNTSMALMGEAERVARQTGKVRGDIMANLVDHPEVFQRAASEAERRVLQSDLGGIFKAIQTARGNPVVGTIIPFLQTNANIYKIGLMDLGGASAVGKTRAVGAATKTGDARLISDARTAAADARGEALIGSSIMTFAAAAAIDGTVSGAGPLDSTTRDELMATGWRPYSVKIGDTWWDYKRYLGPLFIPIAIAANAVEAAKYGGQTGDLKGGLATFATDFGKMFWDQTGLKGLVDFVDATTNAFTGNPAQGWDRLAEGLATSYVPAGGLLATFARVVDPNVKDPDGMLQAIYARVPGLSAQVPNKIDVLGNVQQHDQPGAWSLLPFKGSKETPSAVLTEYQRLREQGQNVHVGQVSGSIQGVKLTPEQTAEYQELAGKLFSDMAAQASKNATYQAMSPEMKAKILTKLRDDMRETAREYIVAKGGRDFQYQRYLAATGQAGR